jgi:hypothetical protein
MLRAREVFANLSRDVREVVFGRSRNSLGKPSHELDQLERGARAWRAFTTGYFPANSPDGHVVLSDRPPLTCKVASHGSRWLVVYGHSDGPRRRRFFFAGINRLH